MDDTKTAELKDWRILVQNNLDGLCKCTVVSSEMVTCLFQSKLISGSEHDSLIDTRTPNYTRATLLYARIATRWNNEGFEQFKTVLDSSLNREAYGILNKQKDEELFPTSAAKVTAPINNKTNTKGNTADANSRTSTCNARDVTNPSSEAHSKCSTEQKVNLCTQILPGPDKETDQIQQKILRSTLETKLPNKDNDDTVCSVPHEAKRTLHQSSKDIVLGKKIQSATFPLQTKVIACSNTMQPVKEDKDIPCFETLHENFGSSSKITTGQENETNGTQQDLQQNQQPNKTHEDNGLFPRDENKKYQQNNQGEVADKKLNVANHVNTDYEMHREMTDPVEATPSLQKERLQVRSGYRMKLRIYPRRYLLVLLLLSFIPHCKEGRRNSHKLANFSNYVYAGFWMRLKWSEDLEVLYKRILAKQETELGKSNLTVAMTLNTLAALYSIKGKYEAAEVSYLRALHIRTELQGEDHPDILVMLNVIADFYKNHRKFKKANDLYKRILKVLSDTDRDEFYPDLAKALTNLGVMCLQQEMYEEAEAFYLQALEITKKIYGEYHSEVANSFSTLGTLYHAQEKHDKAVPIYKRVVEIRKEVFGEMHAEFADSLTYLGAEYCALARYEEALPIYKRALEIRIKVHGRFYADVADSTIAIGHLHHELGQYEDARTLFKQALETLVTLYGEYHAKVAESLTNLGTHFYAISRYEDAIPCFKKAEEIWEKTRGEHHESVAESMANLGKQYEALGRNDEAIPCYEKAFKILKASHGVYHVSVAESLTNLGRQYQALERYEDAVQHFKKALQIFEILYGEYHVRVSETLTCIGTQYYMLERYEDAAIEYKRALKIRSMPDPLTSQGTESTAIMKYENTLIHHMRALETWDNILGENTLGVAELLTNLGKQYQALSMHEEAIPHYERALKILKQLHGEYHESVVDILIDLGTQYHALEEYKDAVTYYKQALEILKTLPGGNLGSIPEVKTYTSTQNFFQGTQVLLVILSLVIFYRYCIRNFNLNFYVTYTVGLFTFSK